MYKEDTYSLSIIPDYKKCILHIAGLVVLLIFLFVSLLLLVESGWLPKNVFDYKFIIPLYLIVSVVMVTVYATKSLYKDEFIIQEDIMKGKKSGFIRFRNIVNYQRLTNRSIPYCLISFESGEKWSIAPSNHYSKSSVAAFEKFVEELEIRLGLSNQLAA